MRDTIIWAIFYLCMLYNHFIWLVSLIIKIICINWREIQCADYDKQVKNVVVITPFGVLCWFTKLMPEGIYHPKVRPCKPQQHDKWCILIISLLAVAVHTGTTHSVYYCQ